MEIIDNINRLLGDDLKKTLTPGSKLKIAASSFSIYAFEALKAELEKIESLEFIFTSPTFVPDQVTDKLKKERREFHIPKLERERGLYGSEFEIRLKNKLTQRAVARECAEWVRRKTAFRSNQGTAPMQQFACIRAAESEAVYIPLHGFTAVDLGYQPGNAVSNMVNRIDEQPFTSTYIRLFDQIWNDPGKLEDVTARLCDHIASVYQENSPERIYFLMLYNIFKEFLEDISADVLPDDLTGYQDSLIWKKLYNFQRDAATGIINKLETYSGCILADSVGLGKTFNRFNDLRNQLALAYEGDPENLSAKLKTEKDINDIFRKAQAAFNTWSTLPPEERTPAAILNALDFDFFELLDSVTIARSRKHIETFYDTTDIGTFPQRRQPLSFHCPLTQRPDVIGFNDIFDQLSLLKLGIYAPVGYILPSRLAKYEALYDTEVTGGRGKLKQADREKSLQALMTVNLLKRLESSVEAFRLTLLKLSNHHVATLSKIEEFSKTGRDTVFFDRSASFERAEPEDDEEFSGLEDGLDDETAESDDDQIGGKVRISLSDMDLPAWEHDLRADLGFINALLTEMRKISPADDAKLQHLKTQILSKLASPINPGNRKILIFTAFADTANYLYEHLAARLLQAHLLRGRNQRLPLVPAAARNRKVQNRLRPQVLRQDHVRSCQIRCRG